MFFFLVLFTLASFLAGSWYSKREETKAGVSAGRSFSEHGGAVDVVSTPDREGQGTSSKTATGENDSAGMDSEEMRSKAPGTVKIGPERQQLVGIRTARVEKKPWRHIIRAFGRVAADETRIYRLIAPLDGWIVETFDNSTGSLVKKDEPLASFYSLDILTFEQEYLSALSTLGRLRGERTVPSPGEQSSVARLREKRASDGLRSLGMSDVQIKEFERTREFAESISSS